MHVSCEEGRNGKSYEEVSFFSVCVWDRQVQLLDKWNV